MRRALFEGLATALAVLILATLAVQPRVIGWQCDGKLLPQLAGEEDELPPCKVIEPIF